MFIINLEEEQGITRLLDEKKLVKGKKSSERVVIASLPENFSNCYDEFNSCKRLRREVSCKLDYFQVHCCLTCHHYD